MKHKYHNIMYCLGLIVLLSRYLLFIFILAFFIAAGVFIWADGRLDWIVLQERFGIPVQIVKTFRLWPEQS